jgi:hypothetical protein
MQIRLTTSGLTTSFLTSFLTQARRDGESQQ